MKFRRLAAEYTIFHGTITQPAVTVMRTTPLLMLMYLQPMSVGNQNICGDGLT
jgi:hypothetical protein